MRGIHWPPDKRIGRYLTFPFSSPEESQGLKPRDYSTAAAALRQKIDPGYGWGDEGADSSPPLTNKLALHNLASGFLSGF